MPVYYCRYYIIRSGRLQARVLEVTQPDYIISTQQMDYHCVSSRTNESPKFFEKYCNAIGCHNPTITTSTEQLHLLSLELIFCCNASSNVNTLMELGLNKCLLSTCWGFTSWQLIRSYQDGGCSSSNRSGCANASEVHK